MKTFEQKLSEAQLRIAEFDKIDGGDWSLRTIREALEAGLKCPDTGAGFDALVMLDRVIKEDGQ